MFFLFVGGFNELLTISVGRGEGRFKRSGDLKEKADFFISRI